MEGLIQELSRFGRDFEGLKQELCRFVGDSKEGEQQEDAGGRQDDEGKRVDGRVDGQGKKKKEKQRTYSPTSEGEREPP